MSGRSRRLILERVHSIDRRFVWQTWFATLTVPRDECDWWGIERHRRAWIKRLRRQFGRGFVLFWKKEPHKSGTPHLHCLIMWLVGSSAPSLQQFRQWNDDAWADVVQSPHPAHRRVGAQVQRMRSWNGVSSYCAKYLGKDAEFKDSETGRVWGIENRSSLPVNAAGAVLSPAEGARVHRILRRLQQRKRQRVFAFVGGRWQQLHQGAIYGPSGSITGYADPLVTMQRLQAAGVECRVRRPSCATTRVRDVWAEGFEVDSRGRERPVKIKLGQEIHTHLVGLQLCSAETIARVVEAVAPGAPVESIVSHSVEVPGAP